MRFLKEFFPTASYIRPDLLSGMESVTDEGPLYTDIGGREGSRHTDTYCSHEWVHYTSTARVCVDLRSGEGQESEGSFPSGPRSSCHPLGWQPYLSNRLEQKMKDTDPLLVGEA